MAGATLSTRHSQHSSTQHTAQRRTQRIRQLNLAQHNEHHHTKQKSNSVYISPRDTYQTNQTNDTKHTKYWLAAMCKGHRSASMSHPQDKCDSGHSWCVVYVSLTDLIVLCVLSTDLGLYEPSPLAIPIAPLSTRLERAEIAVDAPQSQRTGPKAAVRSTGRFLA